MTFTIDMGWLEDALWKAFQSSVVRIKRRRRTACGIEYVIVQQCVARVNIRALTNVLLDDYAAYAEITTETIITAKKRIRRLLFAIRNKYRLMMKRLAERSRCSTGRISNRDTIYRAVLAAMPTPPTVAFAMGGAV